MDGVKRDSSTIRENIMRGLLRPFESCDSAGAACVTFKQFKKCVGQLCGVDSTYIGNIDLPSDAELRRLADFFESNTQDYAGIISRRKPKPSSKVEKALKLWHKDKKFIKDYEA